MSGFGIKANFNDDEKGFMESREIKPKSTEEPPKQQTTEQPETNAPEPPAQTTEAPKEPEVQTPQNPAPAELTPQQILEFVNKDREVPFETYEDIFRPKEVEKEVVKEVDPWEGVLDEYDREYLKFKKDVGGTREQFDFIQQDFSKMDPLDLAVKRIREDTGLNLSVDNAKTFLEDELGIDLTGELDTTAQIKLRSYNKPYIDKMEGLKDKYKTPSKEFLEQKAVQNTEMVTLDNGFRVPKETYNSMAEKQRLYREAIKKSNQIVDKANFQVQFEEKGEKKTMEAAYEYSSEDKHRMLSGATDIEGYVEKLFGTEKGLNHAALQEGIAWLDQSFRSKVISSLIQQARAQVTEEMLARSNNETFRHQPLPPQEERKKGYGKLGDNSQGRSGFGINVSGFPTGS